MLIRDKFSFYFIFSCFISIIHGLSHKYYPFLDEKVGVNKEIDVWQDQIVHLNQAILLYSIYYIYTYYIWLDLGLKEDQNKQSRPKNQLF